MFDKKKYAREYYLKNKEKLNAYSKQKNIIDKEKNKKIKEVYAEHNLERIMLLSAKKRSKNLPFNLELSDIIIPEYCPYLKIPLTNIRGMGRVWTNPSLDKIVPELGYVKGNIEVISMLANLMKCHATKEQLLQFATSVLEREKIK